MLARESAILEMLAKLATRYAPEKPKPTAPGKEHKAVKQVSEYIIELYDRNISLEELTRLANSMRII